MSSTAECSSSNSVKDAWAIRPCEVYKEEYSDCTSIKARFHQYFIYGKNIDCSQWQTDYKNCKQYKESHGRDIAAGEAVVESEELRRSQRLQAHNANDTWKRRTSPPSDWTKPLPDWMVKRNESTYLEMKQMELNGQEYTTEDSKSFCAIM